MNLKYPNEVSNYIKENAIGVGNQELTDKVNKKFGTTYTREQIKRYKANHKISSGLTGRFERGMIPFNKGKKGIYAPGCEKGWFKKGNTPHNHKPVGSERVDCKDGYTLVKTAEPNKWELKQHVVWNEYYGDIPKGQKIVFLDGDKTNFDINNLSLVTEGELLTMNNNGLIYNDSEATKVGIMVAKVMTSRSKAKRIRSVSHEQRRKRS